MTSYKLTKTGIVLSFTGRTSDRQTSGRAVRQFPCSASVELTYAQMAKLAAGLAITGTGTVGPITGARVTALAFNRHGDGALSFRRSIKVIAGTSLMYAPGHRLYVTLELKPTMVTRLSTEVPSVFECVMAEEQEFFLTGRSVFCWFAVGTRAAHLLSMLCNAEAALRCRALRYAEHRYRALRNANGEFADNDRLFNMLADELDLVLDRIARGKLSPQNLRHRRNRRHRRRPDGAEPLD